jgi:putative glutamine amidotransferase
LKNGSRYPLIGLPTLPIPALEATPPRYGVNRAYVRALEAAGAAPVMIPLLEDVERVEAIYRRLDGIVLPGGGDVAPEEYRERRIVDRAGKDLNLVDPPRDRLELDLARWAVRDDLPTLGICRGQQVLNVALGGSLYQDLIYQGVTEVEHSHRHGKGRSGLIHSVRLDPDSRIAQLIDETVVEVNSLHHQAVKDVAASLRVTGTSDDGVIEALESPDHRFLISVQWHPEEIADKPWVQLLFRAFVDAASSKS